MQKCKHKFKESTKDGKYVFTCEECKKVIIIQD